ncbi:cache domain-containing protein, partial [Desulfosarcina cetonica]|uniref:cache domain-containing protein n=1 Tax=Desulfosarcina cetonica TaxID=90730 RepID=UPI000B0A94C9
MHKKVDFIKYVQIWGVIFLLGTGIALIIIDATYAYRDFRLRADQIRSDYIAHQKQVIKQEVMRVVDIIQYKKSQSEKITKRKIKSRVYEAFSIAQNIYQQGQKGKREAEIQQMVVNALRPIRFENGSGYYFITRFDGVEILFADRPGMEGRNLLTLQDTHGRPVIKDMIALARQTGEGFYTYHWTKPGTHGSDFKKISYIKRFAPWDWLIGTGLYVDDIEAEIKSDLLADISRIRFGKEGYIFVNRLNGDALVSNGKRFSGAGKLWDVFNDNPEEMKAIFEKEYQAALKPHGDYIQ